MAYSDPYLIMRIYVLIIKIQFTVPGYGSDQMTSDYFSARIIRPQNIIILVVKNIVLPSTSPFSVFSRGIKNLPSYEIDCVSFFTHRNRLHLITL